MKEIKGRVINASRFGKDDFICEIYSTSHSNLITMLCKSNLKFRDGDLVTIKIEPKSKSEVKETCCQV